MVWKLKKTKAADDEPAGVDSAVQTAVAAPEDDLDFETGIGPSEAVFAADESAEPASADFYSERMAAVDEAIASLTNSKKLKPPSAPNGASSAPPQPEPPAASTPAEEDDWSLDAFAPYKPPQRSGTPPPTAAAPSPSLGIGNTGLEGLLGGQPAEEIDFTKGAIEPETAVEHLDAPDLPALDEDDILASGATVDVDEEEEEWTLDTGDSATDAIAPESDQTLKFAPAPAPVDDDRTVTHVNLTPEPETTLIAPTDVVPTAPPAVGPARLEIKLGQFTAKYDLGAADTVIGRPDPNTGEAPAISVEWDDAISRKHAQVILKDGRYCIVDLDSKNGTFLNGKQLPAQLPVALSSGDEILVGERTKITFVQ